MVATELPAVDVGGLAQGTKEQRNCSQLAASANSGPHTE